jgi:hypothetical protein
MVIEFCDLKGRGTLETSIAFDVQDLPTLEIQSLDLVTYITLSAHFLEMRIAIPVYLVSLTTLVGAIPRPLPYWMQNHHGAGAGGR